MSLINPQNTKSKNLFVKDRPLVLIVEDEDVSFYLLSEILSGFDIHYMHAKDGEEAMEIFQQFKNDIDLIIMDIKMPQRDGFETTREIKQVKSSMPVIALTACAQQGIRFKSFEAGCDSFINKPFEISELIWEIDKYIKLN